MYTEYVPAKALHYMYVSITCENIYKIMFEHGMKNVLAILLPLYTIILR